MRDAICNLIIGVVAFALCLAPGLAASEVVVVVSADSPVTSLSANQLADIYLGRAVRFPGGTLVTPIDLAEDNPLREEFYTSLIGKSQAQIRAHWSKLIFTGRGQPPQEAENAEQVKRMLAQSPGLISYMAREQVDSSVRVIYPPADQTPN